VPWTIENDYGAYGGIKSAATTVEACQTDCSNNPDCTAIDWVVAKPAGKQCYLIGSWIIRSEPRAGIQRHTINRECGQHLMYIWWN